MAEEGVELEIPDKLVPVFEGEARYRISYGGRGSGKTRTFALMTAIRGYQWGMSGQRGQILCAREFMNSLAESSFEEIKSAILATDAEGELLYPWLADYYEIGRNYIRSKDDKIQYTFIGLRHSLDSIKSKAHVLLCWVDEAEPVAEEAWMKLIPTVREHGSEIWVTWNPESKHSATHKRFRENAPENSKSAELNYHDNPWFPDVLEQERLHDYKTRPEYYDHIWRGDFLDYKEGMYYKQQLMDARDEGRIKKLTILPSKPCMTFWDIGNSDGTAIWVVQEVDGHYHLIDFYEAWGETYAHAVTWLQSLGHVWEAHYLPHDAGHKRQGETANKSPQMMLQDLMPGVEFVVLPRIPELNWGIQHTRDMFPLMYFDSERCEAGLDHIKLYCRKWSNNEKRWLNKPDKSEGHSESADALRMMAEAWSGGHLGVTKGWDKPIRRNMKGIV